MQDIIPPKRLSRGQIRPPVRPAGSFTVSRPTSRVFYSRRTRTVNDVVETFETFEKLSEEPTPMIRSIEHLSPDAKVLAIEQALVNSQRALKSERRKRKDLKRFGLVFMASIFVLATGYVSLDTWITNNRVKAETAQEAPVEDGNWAPEQEGKDETEITPAVLGKYVVATDLPRAIYINKLKVAARVLPMGVNSDGAIQAPRNAFDAGWYNGSVKPGEIGAMFVDAHASGPTREGLFAYLDKLAEGDMIDIEKGDGIRLSYRVVHTEVAGLNDIDMRRMLLPYGNALRGLNLMTCTGEWLADQETFDQRVLVWAEQV